MYVYRQVTNGDFVERKRVKLDAFDRVLVSDPMFYLLRPRPDFEVATLGPGVTRELCVPTTVGMRSCCFVALMCRVSAAMRACFLLRTACLYEELYHRRIRFHLFRSRNAFRVGTHMIQVLHRWMHHRNVRSFDKYVLPLVDALVPLPAALHLRVH